MANSNVLKLKSIPAEFMSGEQWALTAKQMGLSSPKGHPVVSEGLTRQQRTPRRGLCSQ